MIVDSKLFIESNQKISDYKIFYSPISDTNELY